MVHGSSVLEALVGPLCSVNRFSLGRLRAAIDSWACFSWYGPDLNRKLGLGSSRAAARLLGPSYYIRRVHDAHRQAANTQSKGNFSRVDPPLNRLRRHSRQGVEHQTPGCGLEVCHCTVLYRCAFFYDLVLGIIYDQRCATCIFGSINLCPCIPFLFLLSQQDLYYSTCPSI